jgi:hypothetical protein
MSKVRQIFGRYWSLAAALLLPVVEIVAESTVGLGAYDEVSRAVLSVICIALLVHSWFIQRRYVRSKWRIAFFTLLLSLFVLGPIWLGLNVVRFYAYPEHCECSFPIINADKVYSVVSAFMDVIMRSAKVLCTVVVSWVIVDLVRWLAKRVRA